MRNSVGNRKSAGGHGHHDPRAAAIADRILFLADGLVVKDMTGSTWSEVIAAMEELSVE